MVDAIDYQTGMADCELPLRRDADGDANQLRRGMIRSRRTLAGTVIGGAIVLVTGAAFAARLLRPHRTRAALPVDALVLHVSHAQGSVVLDGDTDDPGWQGDVARTGAFLLEDGTAARPHSEAKVTWGDGYLYLELYAADQDIRAMHEVSDGPVWESDSFHVVLNDGFVEHSFDVSPLGTLTDGERRAGAAPTGSPRPFDYRWNSGAHLSHELDGTPNQPADEDEEWVIEMAIPFDAIGLVGERGESVALSMHRCDTLKSGTRSCGSWGEGPRPGALVLD